MAGKSITPMYEAKTYICSDHFAETCYVCFFSPESVLIVQANLQQGRVTLYIVTRQRGV